MNFDDQFAKVFGRRDARTNRSASEKPGLESGHENVGQGGPRTASPEMESPERMPLGRLEVRRCSGCRIELPARMRSCFQCNAPLEEVR